MVLCCDMWLESFALKKRKPKKATQNWRLTICQPKRYRNVSIENVDNRSQIDVQIQIQLKKTICFARSLPISLSFSEITSSLRCGWPINLTFFNQKNSIFFIRFQFKLAFNFILFPLKYCQLEIPFPMQRRIHCGQTSKREIKRKTDFC